MGYSLGIDLGTTTCVVARRHGSSVEISDIGPGGAPLPAVALPTATGGLIVGEEADARSVHEPPLVARHLLARLGDGEPVDVGGSPVDPLGLATALLAAAADRAAPSPGTAPDHVVVAFPLEPGTGPEDLLSQASAAIFGTATTLVPAPVAAVARMSVVHDLGDDSIVAVVDLGGSTVDVALVRRTPAAFDLVGDAAVLPDLGGVDLDGAVLSLVEGAIGDVSSRVDPADRAGMLALRRVRAACRAAKERLSSEATAIVDVAVPHARGRVEITREAFERTVEPTLTQATDLVAATIDAAGLTPPDVRAVVLTGGTARIPLVTTLLADRLGRPVLRDDAPETTTALGAAMFADVDDTGAATPAGAADPGGPALSGPGLAAEVARLAGVAGAGGLAGLPDLSPVGPVTGGGPLPRNEEPISDAHAWSDPDPDTGPHATTPEGPGIDDRPDPTPDTGPHATTPEGPDAEGWPPPATGGWDDPAAFPPAGAPWEDQRTSVFADPVDAPAAGPVDDAGEWGRTSHDDVRRVTTSDTDPFGARSGSLASRLRDRTQAGDDVTDDDLPDKRLVIGGAIASVAVIVAGAGLAVAGLLGGGDDDTLAVAEPAEDITTTTTMATTTPPTTTAPTTTEATTTTPTTERQRAATPTTEAPAPATPPPPPATASPPPPTTTTTRPRPPATTTTTPPPTTTTTLPDLTP